MQSGGDDWVATWANPNTCDVRLWVRRIRSECRPAAGEFWRRASSGDRREDDPTKYIGQRISVGAEVEEVYGPRLFTIDEPNWGDLDGEILVLVPTPLAAFVREDDRVAISGTISPFMRADMKQQVVMVTGARRYFVSRGGISPCDAGSGPPSAGPVVATPLRRDS
jgi:hypothetical protein